MVNTSFKASLAKSRIMKKGRSLDGIFSSEKVIREKRKEDSFIALVCRRHSVKKGGKEEEGRSPRAVRKAHSHRDRKSWYPSGLTAKLSKKERLGKPARKRRKYIAREKERRRIRGGGKKKRGWLCSREENTGQILKGKIYSERQHYRHQKEEGGGYLIGAPTALVVQGKATECAAEDLGKGGTAILSGEKYSLSSTKEREREETWRFFQEGDIKEFCMEKYS